jgi:hypothetical protein
MFFKIITARKLRESRSTAEIQAEAQHAHHGSPHHAHHHGGGAHPGSAEGEPA